MWIPRLTAEQGRLRHSWCARVLSFFSTPGDQVFRGCGTRAGRRSGLQKRREPGLAQHLGARRILVCMYVLVYCAPALYTPVSWFCRPRRTYMNRGAFCFDFLHVYLKSCSACVGLSLVTSAPPSPVPARMTECFRRAGSTRG